MKLGKLADPQYQTVLRKLLSQDLPLRTAFKLKGIAKICEAELAKYEEVRKEALQKFGNKKEDGTTLDADEKGMVQFSEENGQAFIAELNSLLDTEVECGSLKAAELGDKATLSTTDLLSIGDLITE